MNDINFKESRIAVSDARKNPTAQSKAIAIQLLKELSDAISSLTEVERPPDGWKLAKKTRKTRNRNAKLELQQAKTCVCVTYIKGKAEKSYQAPRNTSDAVLPKGMSVERAMRLLRMQLQESSNL
jgi:hypothetical protein